MPQFYPIANAWHRSENVAFDAVSRAAVPVLSEGGPAKWLKNKNLQNHLCDYEPGGREFESLRAHHRQKKMPAQSRHFLLPVRTPRLWGRLSSERSPAATA